MSLAPPPAFRATRRQALALAGAALLTLPASRAARALTLRARQDIAPHLYEIEYSTRQRAAFAASAGGFGPGAPQSRILRLDPATLAVQAEIALPFPGFGLALDDANGRLYVGHALDAAVSVLDIAENRLLATIRLDEKRRTPEGKEEAPYGLRRLALDPARGRLYLPGLALKDGVLYVVDTRKQELLATVPGIGPAAAGIALEPSGGRIFISTLAGQLVTVDAERLAATQQVAAGGAEQPLKLAWDPAGHRLLAIDQGLEGIRRMQAQHLPGFVSRNPGNRVVALDPDTGALLAEGKVPDGPVALLPDAARGQLHVASRGSGMLSTLSLDTLAQRAALTLPVHPNSLALAGDALLVTVKVPGKPGSVDPEAVARVAL